MSKDVANYIWKLAKADKTYEGLTLRQTFKRKIEDDKDTAREKLFLN